MITLVALSMLVGAASTAYAKGKSSGHKSGSHHSSGSKHSKKKA